VQVKERCVDNAIGLDGQLWRVRQPEVQSKVDILAAPPVTEAEAAVQTELRLNPARSIRKWLRELIDSF